jgi:hypothetical protein
MFTEFAAMAAANAVVAFVTALVVGDGPGPTSLTASLFLIGLLTLIVVIYDRSFSVFLLRQRQARLRPDRGRHEHSRGSVVAT